MTSLPSRADLLLAGVAMVACPSDSEVSETPPGSDTTSTTSTTGDTTLEPSTGEGTSSTTADPSGSTSGAADSTGALGPECGNGEVEGDEECDDGNDSELDDCLSTCVAPACDDGELNGDETDVDCGGSCGTCSLCQPCVFDADCESAHCNADKLCGYTARMEVDGLDNCWTTTMYENNVVISDVPAGNYRATAVMSGWAGFPPPWSPPATGTSWFVECVDVTFMQMRTPGNSRYGSYAEAFQNIQSPTEDFQWLGGDFSCGRSDTVCSDNNGSVIFDINLMCPEMD